MAVKRKKNGQLKKGSVLNPEGKTPGTIDFKTKWFIFIDKVAKTNNITPDEVEEQLLAAGFKAAKEGSFNFYKDTFDRVYGQATSKLDLNNPLMNEEIKKNTEMVKSLIESFKDGRRKKTTLPETPPPV